MAENTVVYQGTGRRKNAVARVRLVPKRLRFVHQTAQAVPSAVLVECRKGGSAEGLSVEPPLLVQSEEYNKIYKK